MCFSCISFSDVCNFFQEVCLVLNCYRWVIGVHNSSLIYLNLCSVYHIQHRIKVEINE